ncbi:MAG: 5-(carboxyamino)imidazole ribonucleotide mutase [Pseudomonadota bacterium]|nr:5-(carboxyamino)imidazole ribonucleotide mutase [Pseudomonadota bacterium]
MSDNEHARVGIIMGSDSDLSVMRDAATALDNLNLPWEMTIVSAHRTPDRMIEYARSAAGRGLQVIIAGAGGAAHLPGMVASLTPLPVVGVPVNTTVLSGQDALLSIVQMPAGIPVATVAIDNATNAGLLAARIIGAGDKDVRARLQSYSDNLKARVEAKITRLEAQLAGA